MVGLEATVSHRRMFVMVLHGCQLLEGSTRSDPFLGTLGQELLMKKRLHQWNKGSGPSAARLTSTPPCPEFRPPSTPPYPESPPHRPRPLARRLRGPAPPGAHNARPLYATSGRCRGRAGSHCSQVALGVKRAATLWRRARETRSRTGTTIHDPTQIQSSRSRASAAPPQQAAPLLGNCVWDLGGTGG